MDLINPNHVNHQVILTTLAVNWNCFQLCHSNGGCVMYGLVLVWWPPTNLNFSTNSQTGMSWVGREYYNRIVSGHSRCCNNRMFTMLTDIICQSASGRSELSEQGDGEHLGDYDSMVLVCHDGVPWAPCRGLTIVASLLVQREKVIPWV